MKIQINNLAHIKEAVIEDKDLTIIVGDNGTGKTLLLETKTLIRNHYYNSLNTLIEIGNFNFDDNITIDMDLDSFKKDIYKQRNSRLNKSFTDYFNLRIPITIKESEAISTSFLKVLDELYSETQEKINKEILLVENSPVEFEFLDLPIFKEKYLCEVMFRMITPQTLIMELRVYSDKGEYVGDSRESLHMFFDYESFNINNSEETFELINESEDQLPMDEIQQAIISMLYKGIYCSYFRKNDILYLPSERNLFMDTALRKTLNELNYDEIKGTNNLRMRYSEYLFNIQYLDYIDMSKRFNKVLKVIPGEGKKEITNLLSGDVNIGKDGEIESLIKADGSIIKRELFSTKQNRFLPYLMLYSPFKNYDEIIIEEPESHLSLKSINELVSFIEVLLLSGKSICITTHSDVFFSRLNNMILTNKKIKTAAYEIKNNDANSYLEKKELGEYGYVIDLFNDELNSLYEDTLNIQNDIEG
ncbi:hypothetical protein ABER75_11140 [Niallia taxi]|uniref:hypothetical protein n=1 Tax=Niallia taxi TaxID=2499688 RepID=UPI003D2A29C5